MSARVMKCENSKLLLCSGQLASGIYYSLIALRNKLSPEQALLCVCVSHSFAHCWVKFWTQQFCFVVRLYSDLHV